MRSTPRTEKHLSGDVRREVVSAAVTGIRVCCAIGQNASCLTRAVVLAIGIVLFSSAVIAQPKGPIKTDRLGFRICSAVGQARCGDSVLNGLPHCDAGLGRDTTVNQCDPGSVPRQRSVASTGDRDFWCNQRSPTTMGRPALHGTS
jgi:hypothetical protein